MVTIYSGQILDIHTYHSWVRSFKTLPLCNFPGISTISYSIILALAAGYVDKLSHIESSESSDSLLSGSASVALLLLLLVLVPVSGAASGFSAGEEEEDTFLFALLSLVFSFATVSSCCSFAYTHTHTPKKLRYKMDLTHNLISI